MPLERSLLDKLIMTVSNSQSIFLLCVICNCNNCKFSSSAYQENFNVDTTFLGVIISAHFIGHLIFDLVLIINMFIVLDYD